MSTDAVSTDAASTDTATAQAAPAGTAPEGTDRTVADFWFDPMCPYAWITSRWMIEVAKVRPVEVRWHVMSLAVLNEDPEDGADNDPMDRLWLPVRICVVVERRYGQEALARLYTALGTWMHDRGERGTPAFRGALADAGLPADLADAAYATDHDAAVRESHAECIAQLGDHVGTPLITVTGADGRRMSFFGPVLSRMPRTERIGPLWDAVLEVAAEPDFHELKGRRLVKARFDRPD